MTRENNISLHKPFDTDSSSDLSNENIIHTNSIFLDVSLLFESDLLVIEYTLKKRLVLSLNNRQEYSRGLR